MYNTYHADVQTEASCTQRFAHTLKLSIASEGFATTVCQCALLVRAMLFGFMILLEIVYGSLWQRITHILNQQQKKGQFHERYVPIVLIKISSCGSGCQLQNLEILMIRVWVFRSLGGDDGSLPISSLAKSILKCFRFRCRSRRLRHLLTCWNCSNMLILQQCLQECALYPVVFFLAAILISLPMAIWEPQVDGGCSFFTWSTYREDW